VSIELKIKSKHLGEEAKIIRFEERKLRKQINWLHAAQQSSIRQDKQWVSLNNHRRSDVRDENRATFLARAYIKGVPYKSVETKRVTEKEFAFNIAVKPRVVAMVAKYGFPRVPPKIYVHELSRLEPNTVGMQVLKETIQAWFDA
jgi:hypothetical protein